MQTEARLTRSKARATQTPLTAPLAYNGTGIRSRTIKKSDLPRTVLFDVTNDSEDTGELDQPDNEDTFAVKEDLALKQASPDIVEEEQLQPLPAVVETPGQHMNMHAEAMQAAANPGQETCSMNDSGANQVASPAAALPTSNPPPSIVKQTPHVQGSSNLKDVHANIEETKPPRSTAVTGKTDEEFGKSGPIPNGALLRPDELKDAAIADVTTPVPETWTTRQESKLPAPAEASATLNAITPASADPTKSGAAQESSTFEGQLSIVCGESAKFTPATDRKAGKQNPGLPGRDIFVSDSTAASGPSNGNNDTNPAVIALLRPVPSELPADSSIPSTPPLELPFMYNNRKAIGVSISKKSALSPAKAATSARTGALFSTQTNGRFAFRKAFMKPLPVSRFSDDALGSSIMKEGCESLKVGLESNGSQNVKQDTARQAGINASIPDEPHMDQGRELQKAPIDAAAPIQIAHPLVEENPRLETPSVGEDTRMQKFSQQPEPLVAPSPEHMHEDSSCQEEAEEPPLSSMVANNDAEITSLTQRGSAIHSAKLEAMAQGFSAALPLEQAFSNISEGLNRLEDSKQSNEDKVASKLSLEQAVNDAEPGRTLLEEGNNRGSNVDNISDGKAAVRSAKSRAARKASDVKLTKLVKARMRSQALSKSQAMFAKTGSGTSIALTQTPAREETALSPVKKLAVTPGLGPVRPRPLKQRGKHSVYAAPLKLESKVSSKQVAPSPALNAMDCVQSDRWEMEASPIGTVTELQQVFGDKQQTSKGVRPPQAPATAIKHSASCEPRTMQQQRKEVRTKLRPKQTATPTPSNTSTIYTDVHIPKKTSMDDNEAISSLTTEVEGMKIANVSPAPLRGLPVREGRHTHFDDLGKPKEIPKKTLLRGVPNASGQHLRFE